MKREARRVMISLGGTDESSLSDGAARLSIRTAIEQFPLLKSIFRLLRMILEIDFKLDVIRDMRRTRLFHLPECLLRAQIATEDAIEEHPPLLGPHKIAVRMNHT